MKISSLRALALLGLTATSSAFAQVSITSLSTAFTQNFDSLASAGTTNTTMPTGWAFSESGSGSNTTYAAGTGSDNGGNTYSFGAASNSERALGTLLSGSVTSTFGASFTNNTGSTITRLTISYTGEQWRLGTLSREDRLDFSYSTNATSLTSGTYTSVSALNFIAPTTTGTTGALNGNAVGNQSSISSTIVSLSIPSGSTFWIRWSDFNASSSDDGLAVDNFSVSAIPEPSTAAALLGFVALAGAAGLRRRRRA
jgi:MYXO-CTERM domain-containing protein